MTTTSLCSKSNSVLKKRTKSQINTKAHETLIHPVTTTPIFPRTHTQYCCLGPTRGEKHPDPGLCQTVYLRGPQRVRPKKPRREITQLKTACFSSFIHCKENRFDTKGSYTQAIYERDILVPPPPCRSNKPVFLRWLSLMRKAFERKAEQRHS